MKLRLIIGLLTMLSLSGAAAALSPSYQAVYCYPTGSYWQTQLKAYPAYYAKHDAQFRASYGPGTDYCAS